MVPDKAVALLREVLAMIIQSTKQGWMCALAGRIGRMLISHDYV